MGVWDGGCGEGTGDAGMDRWRMRGQGWGTRGWGGGSRHIPIPRDQHQGCGATRVHPPCGVRPPLAALAPCPGPAGAGEGGGPSPVRTHRAGGSGTCGWSSLSRRCSAGAQSTPSQPPAPQQPACPPRDHPPPRTLRTVPTPGHCCAPWGILPPRDSPGTLLCTPPGPPPPCRDRRAPASRWALPPLAWTPPPRRPSAASPLLQEAPTSFSTLTSPSSRVLLPS